MTNQLASLAQRDYFYLDPFWSVNLGTYIIKSIPQPLLSVEGKREALGTRLVFQSLCMTYDKDALPFHCGKLVYICIFTKMRCPPEIEPLISNESKISHLCGISEHS